MTSLCQKKFISYKLPKIKLINYRQKSPPKKSVITEEQKKPNIRKLLPYSRLGKLYHIEPEKEDNSFTELPKRNFPYFFKISKLCSPPVWTTKSKMK